MPNKSKKKVRYENSIKIRTNNKFKVWNKKLLTHYPKSYLLISKET